MIFENNSKLVMIGDSVTDFDRARPVGEGLFGGIGKSYVGIVDALINVTYPDKKLRVVNMGISGNTVRDLKARWQTDVFDLKPDYLSVMIGINDVWRQFDSPLLTEAHVPLDEYRETIEELVNKTLPGLKGLILMTPYYIESNKSDQMRAAMDRYGAVVKEIAKKYNTILVDTQAAFDEILEYYYSAAINWDRIHPNIFGHTVIARAFLNAVGFTWRY